MKVFSAWGVSVGVSKGFNHLPPGSTPARGPVTVRVDRSGRVFQGARLAEGDLALEVAARAPRHVFVHAGVVRHRDRALLLPGYSHAGKSTLVEALCRRGAIYYSDEYAPLNERGEVEPYPRALVGRQPERHIPAQELGWRPELGPIAAGWIVHCNYSGLWNMTQIPPGQGTLALFAHSVAAQLAPQRVFAAVTRAARGTHFMRGERHEAAAAAAQIMDWMEAT